MGKVKRLELWWQLYLYVTSGSGLRKKPAITLCAFECTRCRMVCIQIWMCQHFYILSCELLRPAAWPLTGRSLNLLHKSPPFCTPVLVKACCETMPSLVRNSYVNFLACGIFNSTQIYLSLGWLSTVHSTQRTVDSERAHWANRSYSIRMWRSRDPTSW
jgi:hypothetical protein